MWSKTASSTPLGNNNLRGSYRKACDVLTQRLNHQFASLDSGSEIRNNLSISGSKDGSSCISAAGGSGSLVHSACGAAGFDVHDASTSADSIAAQLVFFMGGL